MSLPLIDDATLSALVKAFAPASDRGEEGLLLWGKEFIRAHHANPGGLSIEVGTRAGGSALLFLSLLDRLYPTPRPMLWTVDPYGGRPYGAEGIPVYATDVYVTMKKNLAWFPNHTHWLMESGEFFGRMRDLGYWYPARGSEHISVRNTETGDMLRMPMGKFHQTGRRCSFALLDGDHEAGAIERDLIALSSWMAPGGIVVIDNVDTDVETEAMLRRFLDVEHRTKEIAVVTYR